MQEDFLSQAYSFIKVELRDLDHLILDDTHVSYSKKCKDAFES